MDIFKRYIDQQNDQYSNCLDRPVKQASMFIVIACYNEPDILTTLNSLAACYPPQAGVSVLVVVNDSNDASEAAITQNISTLNCIAGWKLQHQQLFFDVQRIYAHALPRKWAGVGWARKIGMDEAVRQINGNNYPDGLIVSFDADSTVLPNYFQAIESAFENNPAFNFFTIHFEHPYDNPELDPKIREGIIRYELHMRYYKNAMKCCGYPDAIHTVGSSFALKASAYVKQGGMNRRKAGEDFYFLHKLVLLGHYGNISSTTVFPAARQSDRVPFGTGAAIKKWSEGSSELNYTYSLEAFSNLKPFFSNPSQFWKMNQIEIVDFIGNQYPMLQSFCRNSRIFDEIVELRGNCADAKVFEKRFFHLLNAFWILKYLNYAHEIAMVEKSPTKMKISPGYSIQPLKSKLFTYETSYIRGDLQTEAIILLQNIGIQTENNISLENLLKIFRNLDK